MSPAYLNNKESIDVELYEPDGTLIKIKNLIEKYAIETWRKREMGNMGIFLYTE